MNSGAIQPAGRPILYAEDEENDAFFMERAFNEAKIAHPLVVVPNGQEAIDYLDGIGAYADRARFPLPCLLLLDLNMPLKSGLDVLKWIRNQPAISTLPVIVLTSSLQDADIHRAYAQGANAYLVKPSAPNELVHMVKTIREFWLTQNRTPGQTSGALKVE
ncbi:MAG TPA: response regulator [Verrucomicrobiae bacterium]|jgi:CheY-like chemotaxis protein